jgi:hypothetical protein
MASGISPRENNLSDVSERLEKEIAGAVYVRSRLEAALSLLRGGGCGGDPTNKVAAPQPAGLVPRLIDNVSKLTTVIGDLGNLARQINESLAIAPPQMEETSALNLQQRQAYRS